MNKNNKLWIFGIMALLLATPVLAADPIKYLSDGFRAFHNMLQNDYIVYGFFIIIFFMIFYAIYAAALGKVKIFNDGDKLNKNGKVLAVAFSLITDLAIFYFGKPHNIRNTIQSLGEPFGIIGGFLLAGMFYLMVFNAFKDENKTKAWRYGLLVASIVLLSMGTAINHPLVTFWGMFIFTMMLIWILIASLLGIGQGKGPGPGGRKSSGGDDDDSEDDESIPRPHSFFGEWIPQSLNNNPQIKLEWKHDKPNEIQGYVLYRKVKGKYAEIARVGPSTLLYYDDGGDYIGRKWWLARIRKNKKLDPSKSYKYKIKALSPQGKKSRGIKYRVWNIIGPKPRPTPPQPGPGPQPVKTWNPRIISVDKNTGELRGIIDER